MVIDTAQNARTFPVSASYPLGIRDELDPKTGFAVHRSPSYCLGIQPISIEGPRTSLTTAQMVEEMVGVPAARDSTRRDDSNRGLPSLALCNASR
jgi:hypothetical protein